MCWRLYSAIIRGNWHLFIKRLQEYWRSRCKNSRRREGQERMKHFERESVITAVFSSRNLGGSMFEQRSVIAPPQGDHKGQYRLNKEKGGSMMERDGRPQGPTHPHPHRPRPYDTPIPVAPCFGGAGAHPCLFERYWPWVKHICLCVQHPLSLWLSGPSVAFFAVNYSIVFSKNSRRWYLCHLLIIERTKVGKRHEFT